MDIMQLFVWGRRICSVSVVRDDVLAVMLDTGITRYVRLAVARWGRRILGTAGSPDPVSRRHYRGLGGPGSFFTVGGWSWEIEDEAEADRVWAALLDMVGPSKAML